MTIPKPEMKVGTGIYTFIWDGEIKIKATLDRIISEGKTLSGELRLMHTSPEGSKLIEQTRLNLLSDMKRNQIAKALTERNSEIDWLNILKYICVMTVEHYRQGEPIQYLGGKPETMEQEYLLYPLLEKGEPTTIFADGGTGKSYLGGYFGIIVHYATPGLHIPGLGQLTALSGATNTLYLDWESTFRDHQRRIWAIKQGLDLKDSEDFIVYRRCYQPLADDIPEIQKIITEKNIGFIIIDSQVAASDGEQDKADGARRYYNALRSLNVTSLTLDHVTKGNGQSGQTSKPYGSTFKWNLSRSQFELKKCQEPGENKIQLALYHRKHNEGTLLKPFGYEIEFVHNGASLEKVVFKSADIPATALIGESSSLTDRIEELLIDNGKMQTPEIAKQLKEDYNQVKSRLNGKKDLFKHYPEGWGVIDNDH